MKKLIITIVAFFTTLTVFAQAKWTCPEFDAAIQNYNNLATAYKKKGNKTWSEALLKIFPVTSENTICFHYTINCDSTYNVNTISNALVQWYKTQIQGAIPNVSGNPAHLTQQATMHTVGSHVGYMNATFINAREELTVDISEKSVCVTATVLGYFSANTWKGTESIAPGSCYPANPDGEQKESHAMAFINCNQRLLNTVSSLIKYLNANLSSASSIDAEKLPGGQYEEFAKCINRTIGGTLTIVPDVKASIFSKIEKKGDEFLGTKSGTEYYANGFFFTVYNSEKEKYSSMLIAPKMEVYSSGHQTISLGLYNSADSLLMKVRWDAKSSDDGRALYIAGESQWFDHLDNHLYPKRLPCDCKTNSIPLSMVWKFLSECKGYIRIAASTYGGFQDIKICTIPLGEAIQNK